MVSAGLRADDVDAHAVGVLQKLLSLIVVAESLPSWEPTPPPPKVLKVATPSSDDLEDMEEVWTAFASTPAMKKKLPSKND